jgi:hypothetical protein
VRIGPRGSGSRQLRALLAREKPLLALGMPDAGLAGLPAPPGAPVRRLSAAPHGAPPILERAA